MYKVRVVTWYELVKASTMLHLPVPEATAIAGAEVTHENRGFSMDDN